MRFGKTRDQPTRLFQKHKGKFEGVIHEKLKLNGASSALTGELAHHSYQDLSHYLKNSTATQPSWHSQSSKRKKPKKTVDAIRFWWEFFYRYILRLGFLDGHPGYTYALCSSFYIYIKQAKLLEEYRAKQAARSAQTPP